MIVFLSFRGEDVRNTFIDHLYASLHRQGILTFKDDKRLKKGERIDNELIKSIQDSKIFIIVFSQNYASSSWCLNELVEIMECQKNTEQIAYPVFYDVDPSEVRKQRESYGEALAKHNNEEVEKWREALREAGGLSGYDVKNTADGHEAEVVKKIVAEISNRLRSSYYLGNDEKLVGMETRIPHLLSCLDIDADDVRMIGIKGMGGAGKTTLARVIFERISFKFEGVSFVDNVRENSEASPSGLQSLQQKILCDVLKDQDIVVKSSVEGKQMMENRLRGIKSLVVLDDVNGLNQLEALAGASNWFKPGSRIIITTRDEQVLKAHGVEKKHDVNLLLDEEAIYLFNRYAFKGDIPVKGYEKHARKVVRYAAGLPLTIKVLGSYLRGQVEFVWIDVLKRLKTIPLKQTLDILELSYNSLEHEHKEMFLDIACLLKGESKKKAIQILENCGYYATYGLTVLEQKSLISFSQYTHDVSLDMHDHLQEMGQNIVRRKHPDEPNKHSRLWIQKEIEEILASELGTKTIRYIKMSATLDPEIIMKGLGGMRNLIFFHVGYDRLHKAGEWRFYEASQYFPNALQYLYWYKYPFCSLPKRFQANKLVALELSHSKIKQLWEGGERKVLDNLKFLDLSRSNLTKLDLGLTPHLEVLNLEGCYYLLELNMSIGCPKLTFLDLSFSKLTKLDLGLTPNLEVLKLIYCCDLKLDMSVRCPKLRSLDLTYSKMTKLDLRMSSNLETLYIKYCYNLVHLDMPFECLKLRSLDLEFLALKKLDLRLTPNLELLNLSHCDDLVEFDMPVGCVKLRSLVLSLSLSKTLNPRQIPTSRQLFLDGNIKDP